MNDKVFFVTGGSGFLGQCLLEELAQTGAKIYALIREGSKAKTKPLAKYANINWVHGDLTDPSIVPSVQVRNRLTQEVTHMFHLAAAYDLEASHEDLYLANVVGTHNAIHFANSLKALQEFHYSSTMAVAGNYSGEFTEKMFREGQSFPNDYASTKFAAEACVRDWQTSVRRVIYRFGIIVGRSDDGSISKIDGPYYLMRALHQHAGLRAVVNRIGVVTLPFDEHARLYLVPVDVAVDAMLTVVEKTVHGASKQLRVYHVMGEQGGIPIRTALQKILEAFDVHGRIIPLPNNRLFAMLSSPLGVPEETLAYMYSKCRFSTDAIVKDFPEVTFPRFEEYSGALLQYAKSSLFEGDAA